MTETDWIGKLIDGRYAIEGVLGSGGMGVVLRARHKFTGRAIAIKILKQELAADPEIQSRFLAEARAANEIGHPNIVQVSDAGRSADGVMYLAMELLDGRPLRAPMQRGELTPGDMRRIVSELLDALHAAHARGFVHRDLKPENVFLQSPGGTAKLLDFGIAKVLRSDVPSFRTATGSMLGTPAYMSPEQIHDPSTVDARTDLWAMGVIVFEMLTGRLPFAHKSVGELMVAVATQPPASIKQYMPTASQALEQFFATALARDPKYRFANAAAMKQALFDVLFTQRASAVAIAPLPSAASADAGMTMATGIGHHRPPTGPAPHVETTPGHGSSPTMATTSSSKTPWVIGIVGVVGIIAIVLAIVATRQPQPQPVASTPVATVGSHATAVPDKTVARDADAAASAAASTAAPTTTTVATAAPANNAATATTNKVVTAPRQRGTRPEDPYAQPGTTAANLLGPRQGSAAPTPPPVESNVTTPRLGGRSPQATQVAGAPGSTTMTPAERCEAACTSARTCGIAMPTCVADCTANAAVRQCIEIAMTGKCTEAAVCGIKAACGISFGQGTCKAAMMCQLACPANDFNCGCRCANGIATRNTLALLKLDVCATNCKFDETCMRARCVTYAMACNGQ